MPELKSGVSIAVFRDGEVLLAKRAKAPFKNCWSLPGGLQDAGEKPEQAAERELLEETALRAHRLEFQEIFEPILQDGDGNVTSHFVLAVYACTDFSGNPKPGDDVSELIWCRLDRLGRSLLTPQTDQVIMRIASRLGLRN